MFHWCFAAILERQNTKCYEVRQRCYSSFYFGLILPLQLTGLPLFIAIIDVFIISSQRIDNIIMYYDKVM